MRKLRLGVNLDHVATLRQARRVNYPDLLEAARIAVRAGADQITLHLREDRRHIQPEDVINVRREIAVPLNLEMAMTEEMLAFALWQKPDWVCLVPEKREELTTEGGLDVVRLESTLARFTGTLKSAGIRVSPFINPDLRAIEACQRCEVDAVELHTGAYAEAGDSDDARANAENSSDELNLLIDAAKITVQLGLHCHAGHGLTVANVAPIAAIPEIEELNIGHALICDGLFVGLESAIGRMKRTMVLARGEEAGCTLTTSSLH